MFVAISSNAVAVRPDRLVLGWVTARRLESSSDDHPGQLSLVIPQSVGAVSTGDNHSHCWGRNDEFCVTVAISDGTLTYSLKTPAVN